MEAILSEKQTPPGARPALQPRSKATRDRILDVLDDSLRRGRSDCLTVNELARLSGVSTGAFYGRFESKAAALEALYSRKRSTLVQAIIEATETAGDDWEKWLSEIAKLTMGHGIENRSLLIQTALDNSSSPLSGSAARANRTLASLIADRLQSWFSVDAAHADQLAYALLALLGAMSRDCALYSSSDPKAVASYEQLILAFSKALLTEASA